MALFAATTPGALHAVANYRRVTAGAELNGATGLARLGLKVVAEGVETSAVALRLKHMQCTYAQGYHFARPLRPEAFLERLGAA